MNGYQTNGAGSPYTVFDTNDNAMHHATGRTACSNDHIQIVQPQPTSFDHSVSNELPSVARTSSDTRLFGHPAHNSQSSENWSANKFGYPQNYQPHWSVSTTHSSTSSHARSSHSSIFSIPQNRISTVSTDSASSGFSSNSRSQYISQAERSLIGVPSPFSSFAPSPVEETPPPPPRKRHGPRPCEPTRDYYKTCESRRQRARRADTVPKYFCTTCKEGFGEKADWKRHEETFQERPEEFQCDFCHAKYFLDKDFVNHHVARHQCVPCNTSTKCSLKKHVQESRRQRTTRTGWGCGFCYHFSSDWTERCHHIARHFDVEGKTMAHWSHSSVIYSLLQRPELAQAWNAVLKSRQRFFIGFTWDPITTGRVEGYPDSNQTLQLQDALEYFRSGQDPAVLAQRAFGLAIAKVRPSPPQVSPWVPPEVPPPVPPKPKNYRVHHEASLQDIMQETESWTQFLRSIIDDDVIPTGVTDPESGAFDDTTRSWFDESN